MEIVAVDIGGTHARFALATIEGSKVVSLGEPWTARTADYASLQIAWEAFAAGLGGPPPRAAAIAVACPIEGPVLKLTNSPWTIAPAALPGKLGLDRLTMVNDFAAIGYALAQLGQEHLRRLCGPEHPLPDEGVISVVGPGTGLGVAQILRWNGEHIVIATEGGHIDFAPLDSFEDALLQRLRQRHLRVSVERIVAGPGLASIYEALAELGGRPVRPGDDRSLWTLALSGEDPLASAALDRFCLALGAVVGDLALAHGAKGVAIGGGLGLRLADHLPQSGFSQRLTAKGRFAAMMGALPVKLITHPNPGLFGAAVAFTLQHPDAAPLQGAAAGGRHGG